MQDHVVPRPRAWARRALASGLGVLLVVAPVPALAADKSKSAIGMSKQAAKEYEAGRYPRAVELYLGAWRTDPRPEYLWALARAEHLAGMHDDALAHYRQFIASPGDQGARVAKGNEYVADIVRIRLAARIQDAEEALKAKEFRVAAQVFLAALALAPDWVDLLFKSAVAEQMAERYEIAEQLLAEYLRRAPQDAKERAEAQTRYESLRKRLGRQADSPPPPPPVGVAPAPPASAPAARTAAPARVPAPPAPAAAAHTAAPVPGVASAQRSPSTTPAWIAIGGGSALVLGGIGLYLATAGDVAAYETAVAEGPGGLISLISYEEAQAQSASINLRRGTSVALIGAGVATAAIGTWLLLERTTAVALVPGANGARLVVAGRF